ncbi:MAG: histidine kinase [Ginsengibacter sp.]
MFEPGLLKWADIRSITLAKSGKLWLGTAQGLASFDGNDIMYLSQFNKARNIAKGYQRIESFADDGIGHIWFAAGDSLVKLDIITGKVFAKTLPNFDPADTLKRNEGHNPYLDGEGKLWLGLGRNGFVIYDTAKQKFEHYNFDITKPQEWQDRYHNTAFYFTQDLSNKNIVWIACYGSGIYWFDKNEKKIFKNFHAANKKDSCWINTKVTMLDPQKDGTIWYSTWGNGMGEYNTKTGSYKVYAAEGAFFGIENGTRQLFFGGAIPSFCKKSDTEYYVAREDTLPAVFNKLTKRYTYINDVMLDKTLPRATDMKTDTRGNTWCLKGGRLFISSPQYRMSKDIPFKNRYAVTRDGIELRDIIWDSVNHIYFAAVQFSQGIYVLDSNFNTIKIIPMPYSYGKNGVTGSALVWRVRKDKKGRLWALGEKLFVSDASGNKMVPAESLFNSILQLKEEFADFEMDESGNIWLHTVNHQLLCWNADNGNLYEINLPSTAKNNESEFANGNILIDNKRHLLYVGDENAIYQYNTISRKFNFILCRDLPDPRVKSYALDGTGNLWVQTFFSGIKMYEPTKLTPMARLTAKEGLTDNLGEKMITGPPGYMLFFTPRGGNVYSCVDSTFVNFDIDNGLLSDAPIYMSYANQQFFFTAPRIGHTQYASLTSLLSLQKNITAYLDNIKVLGQNYSTDTLPEFLNKLKLSHNSNDIELSFSCNEFEFPEKVQYAYHLDGVETQWNYTNYQNRKVTYVDLEPGTYTFHLKARMRGGKWTELKDPLHITIIPAWWQTGLSKILTAVISLALAWLLILWRIKSVRREEHERSSHEKELLELEAKALRSQMNPHFIFNCMNSIKSLIQEHEEVKSINYLTTFSKLIRTIFQNSDKKEISLYDEIETCKFYLQLESMRFDAAFNYTINTDPEIDLKSVNIPALIIQPFIENAIWHGIVPGGARGNIRLDVERNNGYVDIIVEDDGIGREVSRQNKAATRATHDSKGVSLTQSRLELDNLLKQRNAKFEIFDKKDEMGNALGTKVIIKIQEETE